MLLLPQPRRTSRQAFQETAPSPAGKLSARVALVTASGPLFVTV
jgi:hypothetical protein